MAKRLSPDEIRELARRIDRNVPSHRDPDAFHQTKSEIVDALKAEAKAAEQELSDV